MFGTLGAPEMIFIFLLALLLFGPKKLPEIGRTVGKALTEFRRASTELKSTFDRELKTLEQETESLKQVTNEYQYDTYNYDYATSEPTTEGSYVSESCDSTAASPSTASASAPQGAELPSTITPAGTIAHGADTATVNGTGGVSHGTSGPAVEAVPPATAQVSTTSEHSA